MNIVDLVLISILALGAWTGFRRGLIESLAGLLSSLIGFFAGLKYYPVLTAWVNSYFDIKTSLQVFFQTNLVLPAAIKQIRLDKVPLSELGNYLGKVNLPPVLKAQLIEYIQSLDAGLRVQAQLGDVIYQFLATAMINAGAFLTIWFLVALLIRLIVVVIRRLTDNTVIAGFDHGSGMIIGTVVTGFTLTVIIGLVTPLLQVTDLAKPTFFRAVLKSLGESQALPYFQDAFNLLSDRIAAFWL